MMDEPKKRSALYIAKPLRWARQAWRGGSPWRASSFALTRKRSCLISCSQPAGGRIWNFGRQAGWNETERQARRIESMREVEPGNDLPAPRVVCVRGFARQPPRSPIGHPRKQADWKGGRASVRYHAGRGHG